MREHVPVYTCVNRAYVWGYKGSYSRPGADMLTSVCATLWRRKRNY